MKLKYYVFMPTRLRFQFKLVATEPKNYLSKNEF